MHQQHVTLAHFLVSFLQSPFMPDTSTCHSIQEVGPIHSIQEVGPTKPSDGSKANGFQSTNQHMSRETTDSTKQYGCPSKDPFRKPRLVLHQTNQANHCNDLTPYQSDPCIDLPGAILLRINQIHVLTSWEQNVW